MPGGGLSLSPGPRLHSCRSGGTLLTRGGSRRYPTLAKSEGPLSWRGSGGTTCPQLAKRGGEASCDQVRARLNPCTHFFLFDFNPNTYPVTRRRGVLRVDWLVFAAILIGPRLYKLARSRSFQQTASEARSQGKPREAINQSAISDQSSVINRCNAIGRGLIKRCAGESELRSCGASKPG